MSIMFFLPSSNFKTYDWLDKIHFDKFVHIVLFFNLTFLTFFAFHKNNMLKKTTKYIVVASFILYAISTELIQEYLIVSRSGDYYDLTIDVIGIFSCLFLFNRIYSIIHHLNFKFRL